MSRAVGNRVNLLVAGSGLGGAALFDSWLFVAAAAGSCAALVTWDFYRSRSEPDWTWELPRFPDLTTLLDPIAQTALRTMQLSRKALRDVIHETPKGVIRPLGPALSMIPSLEERGITLIFRIDDLGRYLAGSEVDAIRRQRDWLDDRAHTAVGNAARAGYRSARTVRDRHIRVIEEIAATRDRLAAELECIVGTLEALPAEIVRVRALEALARQPSGEVRGNLQGMEDHILSVEQALRALIEAPQDDGAELIDLAIEEEAEPPALRMTER